MAGPVVGQLPGTEQSWLLTFRLRDAAVLLVLGALGLWLHAGVPGQGAVAIVALGFLVAALSPAGATAAVLLAIPFLFEPVQVHGRAFSLIELGILASIFATAVHVALGVLRGEWRSSLRAIVSPLSISLPVIGIAAVAIFSLFTVVDPGHRHESIRELREVIIEPILFFVAARWSLRERGARWLAVGAFLAMGLAIALAALFEIISRSHGVAADNVYRARATYPHPNNLSFYLGRVAVLAAGIVVLLHGTRRWLAAVPLAIVLAGTAATLSRGAMIGVAVGLGIVVIIGGSRRLLAWYGGAVALGVVAFAVLATQRFFASGSGGGESTRILIWTSSLHMLRDHPVFGVGMDQFLYQYERRYVSPAGWPERYTSHPHNIVLDVWLQLGILGLIVFGWLAFVVARRAWRLWRHGRLGHDGIVLGAVAALIAGLVHGMVDNAFFLPDLAVMTWFFVVLMEQPSLPQPPSPKSGSGEL